MAHQGSQLVEPVWPVISLSLMATLPTGQYRHFWTPVVRWAAAESEGRRCGREIALKQTTAGGYLAGAQDW